MKRILLSAFLCLSSIAGYSQENEFYELLAQENKVSVNMIYKDPNFSGQTFTTPYVRIEYLNGYKFHVADYAGGNRVVTCLDGEMKGCQAIGYNGVIFAKSDVVEWHKKYFVHHYIDGQIISYPTKQTAKFN